MTREPSMTTLPAFSKFTVTRSPMTDCTCPSPQSGQSGCRTKLPGSRKSFNLRSSKGSSLMAVAA